MVQLGRKTEKIRPLLSWKNEERKEKVARSKASLRMLILISRISKYNNDCPEEVGDGEYKRTRNVFLLF